MVHRLAPKRNAVIAAVVPQIMLMRMMPMMFPLSRSAPPGPDLWCSMLSCRSSAAIASHVYYQWYVAYNIKYMRNIQMFSLQGPAASEDRYTSRTEPNPRGCAAFCEIKRRDPSACRRCLKKSATSC